MFCKTRKDMYDYLQSLNFDEKRDTPLSSVYFLIKENNTEEAIHFMKYKDSYFESSCQLIKYPMTEMELEEYVKETYEKEFWKEALEYEKTMWIDNIHYEIENFQCVPWLNENIEIIKIMSEKECLQYLMERMCEND